MIDTKLKLKTIKAASFITLLLLGVASGWALGILGAALGVLDKRRKTSDRGQNRK